MLALDPIRERLAEERGYTLIELLTAILAGMVVMGALFSILDVSLHQTARLSDRVQVDQTGRATMTNILDELHSSCISYGYAPVQEGSTGSTLIFVNAYSKEAVITKATKHEIIWNEKAETLTEKAYASSGGAWPSFTFAKSPTSTVRIASNVSQVDENTPIFRYYAYATAAEGNTIAPYDAIKSEHLNETQLKESAGIASIASVQVTYMQAPSDGYPIATGVDRDAIFNSQTTLAFSVPKSEDPIHDAPCQ